MDAASGRIVAATLTNRAVDDAAQVGPLLDQVPGPVTALTGDGAYDRSGVYAAVHERHAEAAVVVPPRADAVLGNTAATGPTQRDHHIQAIAETGRMAWQRSSGYNQRAKVEGQTGRWKQVLGPALRFHSDQAQATEIPVGAAVLNPHARPRTPELCPRRLISGGAGDLRTSSPRCNTPLQVGRHAAAPVPGLVAEDEVRGLAHPRCSNRSG